MDGRTGWRLRFAHGWPIRFRPVRAHYGAALVPGPYMYGALIEGRLLPGRNNAD
jgi:hypothetical protein